MSFFFDYSPASMQYMRFSIAGDIYCLKLCQSLLSVSPSDSSIGISLPRLAFKKDRNALLTAVIYTTAMTLAQDGPGYSSLYEVDSAAMVQFLPKRDVTLEKSFFGMCCP